MRSLEDSGDNVSDRLDDRLQDRLDNSWIVGWITSQISGWLRIWDLGERVRGWIGKRSGEVLDDRAGEISMERLFGKMDVGLRVC